MGVQGLLNYILGTPSSREKIHLRKFAKAHLQKTGKQPELLCDFNSVVKWLLSSYDYAMMEKDLETPYCLLHGGLLKDYSSRVLSFVQTIQSLGLDVVFCIDSMPVYEEEMDVLYSAYVAECSKKVQEASKVLQICTSHLDMTQVQWTWREGVASHVIFTLEAAEDIRMMYCEGKVLNQAISYMQANKHVCGILSDDTSYAIVSGCGLFLIDLFKLDIHQPTPILPTMEPEQDLSCEVVWSTWLASSLDLSTQQLADLAILSGNEYTLFLNTHLRLHETLGVAGMGVVQLAEWLRTQDTRLSNISIFGKLAQSSTYYQKAVKLSFQSYESQQSKFNTLLVDVPLLEEIVSRGGFLSPQMVSVLSSHTYWRASLIEPQIPNCPRFSDVTLIIRMYIYSLLGLSRVNEYGFITASTSPAQIPVDVTPTSLEVLSVLSTNERLGVLCRLVTCPRMLENVADFHDTMTAALAEGQEVTGGVPVTEVLAFSSLVFMRDSNMRIKPTPNILMCELDALLTTMLFSLADLPPLQITHIPPAKGVTVASWFSHLLDQVYWLASCLGLSRDLPAPGDLFSAHQYVLFHLASTLCEDFSEEHLPPLCSKLKLVCSIYQEVWGLGPVLDLRVEVLKDAPTPLTTIMELFRASVDAISSSSSLQETLNELKRTGSPIPLTTSSSALAFSAETRDKEGGVEGEGFQLDLDDCTTSSGDSAPFVIREELSFSQERNATEENEFFSSQSLGGGGEEPLSLSDPGGEEGMLEEEEEDVDSVFDSEWSEMEDGGMTMMLDQLEGSVNRGDGGVAAHAVADSAKVESTNRQAEKGALKAAKGTNQNSAIPPTTTASSKALVTPPTPRPSKTKKKQQWLPPPAEAELPIMAHRSQILELVNNHTVICIEGETGCGKSTKVPQFILDDAQEGGGAPCRILVTQPRRVAAMKLAERVARERGEKLGAEVGYCVGGDHHRVAKTALTYCTIGYLLQVSVCVCMCGGG